MHGNIYTHVCVYISTYINVYRNIYIHMIQGLFNKYSIGKFFGDL